MSGFRSLSPNINVNTESGQLRTELQNTFARLDGQLTAAPYRFVTGVGPSANTGAAETDLFTTTVNAGVMTGVGQSILIHACGQTGANGNSKTLKLYLGSTVVFSSGAIALNNKDWTFQGEIVFSGGNAQITWGQFTSNGASTIVDVNTSTENFGTNLTMKFTGTGTSNADISMFYYKALIIN